MSKHLLTALLVLVSMGSVLAQSGKYLSGYTKFQGYLNTGRTDRASLEEAKEYLDISVSDVDFAESKGKAWYFKGEANKYIYLDSVLRQKYPDIVLQTVDDYMKSLSLMYSGADKKFRYDKEALGSLALVSGDVYNGAAQFYNNKDDEKALLYFDKLDDIQAFAKKNGVEEKFAGLDMEQIKVLRGRIYVRSGQEDKAIVYYTKLKNDGTDDLSVYSTLADLLIKSGKEQEALAVLDEAIAKWPDDINVLISKINVFLNAGKQTEALDMMKKAVALDDQNSALYFALANTYGQLEDTENAKANYLKAIEIKPDYRDAYNNMAAMYMDDANAIIEKMNALGFGSADQKKYEVYEQQRNALYDEALPYLEKSHELDKSSLQTMQVLKEIYAKMGKYDKSKEMSKLMDAARQ